MLLISFAVEAMRSHDDNALFAAKARETFKGMRLFLG